MHLRWAILVAVTLAAVGGSAARANAPFSLTFQAGEATLSSVTDAPAGPGRSMSYELSDGSLHALTSVASTSTSGPTTTYAAHTDESGRSATIAVTKLETGVHVALTFQPSTRIAVVFGAFRSNVPDEHFVGTGIEHGKLDLHGQLVQLKVAYACGRSVVAPFFASSAGYGVYYETDAVGQIEFDGSHDGMPCGTPNELHPLCAVKAAPDRVQVCFKDDHLTFDVFTGTPAQTVADYRVRAGRPAATPLSAFGTIKWRDKIAVSRDVLDDVSRFRSLGIPLGAVLVDNPWEAGGCIGTLRFDKARIPDPARLIRDVHAAGVSFDLWVAPWVDETSSCGGAAGYPSRGLLEAPLDTGRGLVDFTNSAARAEFERRISALAKLGVDGFKGDRGDETDKEGLGFAGGSGRVLHNDYPALFAQAIRAGATQGGDPDPFAMYRAGGVGTPAAGGATWAGDQTPDFAGMEDAIHALGALAASGYGITGSDVGGYSNQTPHQTLTPLVFARWAQLGAISPIFELGGADRAATFWTMGAAASDALRRAVVLHYELVPYLSSLAATWARTGAPVLQPLALVSPGDPQAWAHDLELMLGGEVLAAPVTSATTRPRVYLPRGTWLDLYAGRTVPGGRVVTRVTPVSQFPLYLRAGATIPFDVRTVQLFARAWPLNALRVSRRGGWLTAATSVRIAHAPRESEVLFAGAGAARRVVVNGRMVPRVSSAAALRSARSGWIAMRTPFPGVLVKAAPGSGRLNATVVR